MTRRILSLVYRLSAIRQISGFKTVLDEAVMVSAKSIPIDILDDEIYFRQLKYPEQMADLKAEQ